MPEVIFINNGRKCIMQSVKIKTVASYGGHNVNQAGAVSLKLVFSYDTITKYIQAIQMLNENVNLLAVINGEKIKLGSFMINSINIDHDGAGKIKFNSQLDYVEIDNISKLINSDLFKIMLQAESDVEEVEENEEEENAEQK